MIAPKVFISYSWDNEAHQKWVLDLANQLVAKGVDVTLDQYELQLGANLSHFMERAVADADKVLLILTENYKVKAEGRTGGVGYEYSMINSALYKTQTNNKKFLPILRGTDRETSTPIFVNAFINLDMRSDAQFEQQLEALLRTIFNKPKVVKPPIGTPPTFAATTDTVNTSKPSDPSIKDQMDAAKDRHDKAQQIQTKKSAIQQQIAKGNTKKALELMEALTNSSQDVELSNTIILLSGQFYEYQKGKRLGITTGEEQRIALAKVNNRLLRIVYEITS